MSTSKKKTSVKKSTSKKPTQKKKVEEVIRYNVPTGKLIGYKKVKYMLKNYSCRYCIVELEIPESAHVINASSPRWDSGLSRRKVRTSEAKVRSITTVSGKPLHSRYHRIYSWWDTSFTYTVGQTVRPRKKFSTNKKEKCRSGIHFFLDRKDAEKYR